MHDHCTQPIVKPDDSHKVKREKPMALTATVCSENDVVLRQTSVFLLWTAELALEQQ